MYNIEICFFVFSLPQYQLMPILIFQTFFSLSFFLLSSNKKSSIHPSIGVITAVTIGAFAIWLPQWMKKFLSLQYCRYLTIYFLFACSSSIAWSEFWHIWVAKYSLYWLILHNILSQLFVYFIFKLSAETLQYHDKILHGQINSIIIVIVCRKKCPLTQHIKSIDF